MSLLLDPLRSGLTVHALVEASLVALVCGPVSVWVVAYRNAYAAESLSHAMLPGLVGAALAGVPLMAGGAAGAATAAAGISAAGRDRRIGADTAVAVVVTGLLGLGSLLALAPATPPRLADILFGDLLGASSGDLAAAGAMDLVVLGVLVVAHRRLVLAVFDPVGAAAIGFRPARARLLVLLLLAAATVVAAQGMGNLLLVALLLAPGAGALRVAGSPGRAMVLATTTAIAACVSGIYASYYLDTATGATVALALVGAYVLTDLLAGRRRAPTTPRRLRRRRDRRR
jgi:ABC-type Mn2+/Zn2+ transport system permease subunit